jgi:hypothetical protein
MSIRGSLGRYGRLTLEAIVVGVMQKQRRRPVSSKAQSPTTSQRPSECARRGEILSFDSAALSPCSGFDVRGAEVSGMTRPSPEVWSVSLKSGMYRSSPQTGQRVVWPCMSGAGAKRFLQRVQRMTTLPRLVNKMSLSHHHSENPHHTFDIGHGASLRAI